MLRALMKIVSFLVLALILGIVLGPPINLLLYWLFQPLRWLGLPERLLSDLNLTGQFELISNLFSFVPALLIASLIMTRRLEHRPMASLGLSLRSGWSKEFALGVLLALVSMTPVLILLHLLAPYTPISHPPRGIGLQDPRTYISTPSDWFTVGIVFALVIFLAALFEELIFRGYLFQTLMAVIGSWSTALVTSGLFAVAHYQTHSLSAMVVVGGLGLAMALLYLRSRCLWVAIGFHATVNWLLAVLTVSGLIVFTKELGENWFYAGATGVMVLVLSIWSRKYLKPSEEMEALWQQYVPIARPWTQLRAWWAKRKNKSAMS